MGRVQESGKHLFHTFPTDKVMSLPCAQWQSNIFNKPIEGQDKPNEATGNLLGSNNGA